MRRTHVSRASTIVLTILIACIVAAAPAMALAPLVNATLEPRQISMGESAQLTITGTGSEMDALTLPVVAGLDFRVIGQSRRLEIINGATLSSTSVILRVTPQTAGIFTIPGITPKSQPLVLRVNPDNGSGSASQSNNPYSASPPGALSGSSTGNSSAGGIRLTANGAAFIRMNLPKRDVYVGESIPVDIEVGLRSGFVTSLNGLPTLTGTDFTLNNLSHKPERVEKLIDGQPFTVLTWHSVLAPVKPGTFNLSVESPLTIRVRTRPARDSMIDDLLGDPFMQNFFGATVPKDITVASPPAELKVVALPTEGRPADFSGAVGTFKIASDVSAPTAAVGDPLTLRLHVTGSGNFDRVDTPMLEHVDHWKTYPPKSSFTQGDTVGYKGEKTFEQPVIASQPGTQTLPALTFSYFDPTTQRYETARSTPPAVTIAPALADSAPPVPATTTATANANGPGVSPAPPPSGLRPDHAITSDGTPSWLPQSLVFWAPHSLIPLYLRSPFLIVQSLLAVAFAGGWFGLRRRAFAAATPGMPLKRPSKASAKLLQQLHAAARASDSTAFFTVARDALRQSLAARWGIAAETLAPEEWSARLQGHDDGDELRELFTLADEATYAGHGMTSTDFDRWTQVVRRQLLGDKA